MTSWAVAGSRNPQRTLSVFSASSSITMCEILPTASQPLIDSDTISVASLHVHLNHESCLEVSVLRGALEEVRGLR